MSAPIQASASVQVVPASNCVRSRTRMPLSRPGDIGVTVIVELLAFISADETLRAPPSPAILGHLSRESQVGPEVRISFPPAASLRTLGPWITPRARSILI